MPGCYGLPSYEKDYRITIKTNSDLLAVVKKKTNYRIMRIKEKDRLWRKGVFFFQCCACIFKNMNSIKVTSINVPIVCQSLFLFSRNVAIYINFCRLLLVIRTAKNKGTRNGKDARASFLDPLLFQLS